MRKLFLVQFILCFFTISTVQAQTTIDLFDGQIHEIHVQTPTNDWLVKLADDKQAGRDVRRPVTSVTVDGEQFDKASWKISGSSTFHYTEQSDIPRYSWNIRNEGDELFPGNQKRLRLLNSWGDPSMLRDLMYSRIALQYADYGVVYSRIGIAKLYVNDQYWGVYLLRENIDGQYVQNHFGTDLPLFKMEPADFRATVPAECTNKVSANFRYYGEQTDCYMFQYEFKGRGSQSAAFQELVEVIRQVDGLDRQALEEHLHMLPLIINQALTYVLGEADGVHFGWAGDSRLKNYYGILVVDKFLQVDADRNMAFGALRVRAGNQMLSHEQLVSEAPQWESSIFTEMTEKHPMYEDLFWHFVHDIVDNYLANGWYLQEAQKLQDRIAPHYQEQTFKFYSNEDFLANLEETVQAGFRGETIGIKEYIKGRVAYVRSNHPKPLLLDQHVSSKISKGQLVIIFEDNDLPVSKGWVYYRTKPGQDWAQLPLHDDGMHGDGLKGDGTYCALLPTTASEWYALIKTNSGQSHYYPIGGSIQPAKH